VLQTAQEYYAHRFDHYDPAGLVALAMRHQQGRLLAPTQMAEMQHTVVATGVPDVLPGARYGLGIMWIGGAALVGLGLAFAAWWWPHSTDTAPSPGSGKAVFRPLTSAGPATPSTDPPASQALASAESTQETTAASNRTYLYELPANSAGQPGQQRRPLDVILAGNHYQHSTSMWTDCTGGGVPTVYFYTAGTYQRLAGTLGIADSAPADMSVTVYLSSENGVVTTYTVNRGQVLPLDLDISRNTRVGFSAASAKGCPHNDKPLVYIGDAVVF